MAPLASQTHVGARARQQQQAAPLGGGAKTAGAIRGGGGPPGRSPSPPQAVSDAASQAARSRKPTTTTLGASRSERALTGASSPMSVVAMSEGASPSFSGQLSSRSRGETTNTVASFAASEQQLQPSMKASISAAARSQRTVTMATEVSVSTAARSQRTVTVATEALSSAPPPSAARSATGASAAARSARSNTAATGATTIDSLAPGDLEPLSLDFPAGGVRELTDLSCLAPGDLRDAMGSQVPAWSLGEPYSRYMHRSQSADFLDERPGRAREEVQQPRTAAAFHRPSSMQRIGKNPAVMEFQYWVSQLQDGWTQIHEIFLKEDANPAGGRHSHYGSQGMGGIPKKRWIQLLASKGFKSAPAAAEVFDEVAKEIRTDKKGKLTDFADVAEEPEINLSQMKRFERKCVSVTSTLDSTDNQSFTSQFMKLIVQQRGSVLRAWQLDLDKRKTGRVAYVDFCNACRELGIAPQGKLVWTNLRRQDKVTPLCLHELDPREAANMEEFCGVLWNTVGFDLSKAWLFLDTNNQNYLSYDEFKTGASRLGFEGDPKLLFKGLDAGGLGRVRRCDFEYLGKVSQTANQKLGGGQNSAAVMELITWMQREMGGPEQLLKKLGLGSSAQQEIVVGDLAARLTALGFEGDSLGAASKASRHSGGTHISADSLFSLLCGGKCRKDGTISGATSPKSSLGSPLRSPKSSPSSPGGSPSFRGVWCDSVDNLSEHNSHKCRYTRSYFAFNPRARLTERSPTWQEMAANSAPPSPSMRRRPMQPPPASIVGRPAWDDNYDHIAQIANNGVSSHTRTYFSDLSAKPVREQMRTTVMRKRVIAEARQQQPQFDLN